MKAVLSDPWLYAGACFCVSLLVLCALLYAWNWLNRRAFWRLVSCHPPRVGRAQRRRRRWPSEGHHRSYFQDLKRGYFPEDVH